MSQVTEQETFWRGDFGTEYTKRNQEAYKGYIGRLPFFEKLLFLTKDVQSVCELGANIGQNLAAIQSIKPEIELQGVEINPDAFRQLQELPNIHAVHSSIQAFDCDRTFDLIFTSGVLIHINPTDLPLIYMKMFELSTRYILINEYYNPSPVEIPYRGHVGKLFKRDFAGELLDLYPDRLSVVDYGFLWNRLHPAWDNTTWVLLEKSQTGE